MKVFVKLVLLLFSCLFFSFVAYASMPVGISESDFSQITLFIEKKLSQYVRKKEYFIAKEVSGLSYSLEYDPRTKKTFILLPEGIGQGCHKVIKKALLYDRKNPEIVARISKKTMYQSELQLTKHLIGCPGLIKTVASTKHSLYTKFYNQNSLHTAVVSRRIFTFAEKVQIALGLLTGLKELHKKGIAHRDISLKNCLLSQESPSSKMTAVLCDFGRSKFIDSSFKKKLRVQGHLPNTPPEGIFYKKMKGEDFFKSDLFALGMVLHQLFYHKAPPWKKSNYITASLESAQTRYERYIQAIKNHHHVIRLKIANEKQATNQTAFEVLLLQLCDPDPKKRGTAFEQYKKMLQIYKAILK